MSCPDWRRLLLDRDRALAEADFESSPDWRGAVDHLAGCGRCRAAAVELDPSMLFVAQPPLEVDDDEIERIKTNVRTLRRARETERTAGELRRRIGRAAAAAAIIALAFLLPQQSFRQPETASTQLEPAAETSSPPAGRLTLVDGPAPMIEPLDLPLARIYQLGEEDLSVIMVVDESIDV